MIVSLRRFLKERTGLAAMEFALVAPMILFTTLGAFDLVEMMQANKRIENVAASLADVVSRDTVVMDTELAEYWAALSPLLAPMSAAGVEVRITSATVQTSNRAEVVWSESRGGLTAFEPGAMIDVPDPVGQVAAGVIIVTVRQSWTPPLGIISGGGERTMEQTEFRRPRIADPVLREP